MRVPLLAALVALSLASVPLALAQDEDDDKGRGDDRGHKLRADFAHRGDKWLLHNDDIAVWFHQNKAGKAKPDLRLAWNGTDDEDSGYRVKILRVCEVDESLKCTGKYPRVNLARSDDWNVVTQNVNDSMTLTMVRADSQAIVTLVWHLNTTSHVVKYDVLVENWKWENESHKLALDQVILGKNLKNETGANVSVGDSGYIRWAETAAATYGPGDTRTIGVDAIVKGLHEDDDEDEDEKQEKTGAHLLLVFNGTGGYQTLDYDPEFGLASAASSPVPVPALGVVAGVLAVAVAAFVLRRR